MSIVLRVILIIISVLTLLFMMRKIRKSQFQIEDSIAWILFLFILLVVSIFPKLADWGSKLIGVQSTVNFVFLLVIFILLIKVFITSIKVSQLDAKIKELTEEIAVRDNIEKDKNDEKDSH